MKWTKQRLNENARRVYYWLRFFAFSRRPKRIARWWRLLRCIPKSFAAAEILGVSRSTLYRFFAKQGIDSTGSWLIPFKSLAYFQAKPLYRLFKPVLYGACCHWCALWMSHRLCLVVPSTYIAFKKEVFIAYFNKTIWNHNKNNIKWVLFHPWFCPI